MVVPTLPTSTLPAVARPRRTPHAVGAGGRVLGRVAFVVLGVAAVLAVLVMVVPRLLGFDLRYVSSGSMSPAMPTGSLAVIRPTDGAPPDLRDVVLFREP